jgi:hypothetical protein
MATEAQIEAAFDAVEALCSRKGDYWPDGGWRRQKTSNPQGYAEVRELIVTIIHAAVPHVPAG